MFVVILPTGTNCAFWPRRGALALRPYKRCCLFTWTLSLWPCKVYYKSNRDVIEDFELQNWLQALRKSVTDGGFGVVSLPPRLTNRDQLIDLLTQIIFTSGPQHSAIAWIQYQYMSFIPHMPAAIYQPIPTVKGTIQSELSLTRFLPGVEQTLILLERSASNSVAATSDVTPNSAALGRSGYKRFFGVWNDRNRFTDVHRVDFQHHLLIRDQPYLDWYMR